MPALDVPEDSALRARLLELTLGFDGGQMAWRFGDPGHDDYIVIARDAEIVVGWALIFKLYGRMNLHVFVDPCCRQRGVGRALIECALECDTPLYVTAQSEAAWRLFFRVGLVVADERD